MTLPVASRPSLLVIDSAYTLETIRQIGNEQSILSRDLDGYFHYVWSVHPFASLLTSERWAKRFGPPDWHTLNTRHTFIEGKIGRYGVLRRLSLLNFLMAQFSLIVMLCKLVKRGNIVAVRVGDPLYTGLLGWAVSRICRIPLVLRVNGHNDRVRAAMGRPLMPHLFRTAAIERRVETFIFKRVALLFAPTRDNLDWAQARGANDCPGDVIPFGTLIDPIHFAAPDDRGSAQQDLDELAITPGAFLISVGRLITAKFPDHAVRVLQTMVAAGFDLKLVLVGEGDEADAVRGLAEKLGIGDRLVLAGSRNQQWLGRVVPHAAIVLSPSAGRALSETSLAGVATVAYDTDWQGEMVETGETGILVAYKDWPAMADACRRLLSDAALSEKYGQALRLRALAMLDVDDILKKERVAFDALLKLGAPQ